MPSQGAPLTFLQRPTLRGPGGVKRLLTSGKRPFARCRSKSAKDVLRDVHRPAPGLLWPNPRQEWGGADWAEGDILRAKFGSLGAVEATLLS
jgi:hypothetical protein